MSAVACEVERPRAGGRRGSNAWPRLDRCDRCGESVLLARGLRQGHPFRLEPREVFPAGPCGGCSGRGTRTVQVSVTGAGRGGGAWRSYEPGDMVGRTRARAGEPCPDCGGSGVRGVAVPAGAVALGIDGVARRLEAGEERGPGEAFHVPHRCGAAAAA